MNNKKRYAMVGLGVRARVFYKIIADNFRDSVELVAFCDINRTRMEVAAKILKEEHNYETTPAFYEADQFEKMIEEQKPDCVIVTTIDRTHHKYIAKAMDMGCDVITEKPMTMSVDKCEAIFDAIERTGKELRVAFNYRYAPHNSKMKELLMNGTIGKVNTIHFEWMLNVRHGADYFRRWHRDKRNSGGLLVHKSTHHFDLVNFWLGTYPKTVYAMGDLMFYGRENAEERGETKFYYRTHGSENAKGDPFALQMEGHWLFDEMYLKAEKEDGYIRDQSVFGDNISIEDTMGVLVKYEDNTILTYNLVAYSPCEGYKVCFTGTKGRIEYEVKETTYINGDGNYNDEGAVKSLSIKVYPMFGEPYEVEVEKGFGGHGGGDIAMMRDIFGEPGDDPLHRAATHIDGAMSIMTGICAEKSIATGMPVNIRDEFDVKRRR